MERQDWSFKQRWLGQGADDKVAARYQLFVKERGIEHGINDEKIKEFRESTHANKEIDWTIE